MRKMTVALAATAATAALSVPTQAQAVPVGTGKMTFGEYSRVKANDSKAAIQNDCGCSGVITELTPVNGHRVVAIDYTADNSTFSADVDNTAVKYKAWDDGSLHAWDWKVRQNDTGQDWTKCKNPDPDLPNLTDPADVERWLQIPAPPLIDPF